MQIKHKDVFIGKKKYREIQLRNKSKMEITLSCVGAGIREIKVPDKWGVVKTVTLQPLNKAKYYYAYHGKTIGRTAGRIENAQFSIDGKQACLEKNNYNTDNLHGGIEGLHAKNFGYAITKNDSYCEVAFSYFSPDGEGGYFGNVTVSVTYRIYEEENKFSILFRGETDQKTLLNLTNHVYWNLSGDFSETVDEHLLQINAFSRGVPNERLIVNEFEEVKGPFNFTSLRRIGEGAEEPPVQLYTAGYDHPYLLQKDKNNPSMPACKLFCAHSGIGLNVKTSYPCVVFYSNNFPMENTEVFPGIKDKKRLAVCLECQYPPNGIHQAPTDCGVFTPGKGYEEEIEFEFETINKQGDNL